ncbi:oxidase [Lithospermum erythrorhizon]|uniref:Oxidase n=1 Tax=Lithospermum erythrorhizon TaxID=34254 RepID=A0AAV3NUC3_LITER
MATLTNVLKLLIILISSCWIAVWILKPTQLWTRKWKAAEEVATSSLFGYYGLNLAVYTFPVVAVTIIGLIVVELKVKETGTRRWRRGVATALTNPVVVNYDLGIYTGVELIVVFLLAMFLGWTLYARISNDFKKMVPVKSPFKLNIWQYKLFRFSIRLGSLAEACLALLLLPILRGKMAIFRVIGIQFEASVRYHILLGTALILFATSHGAGIFLIWAIKNSIYNEMWKWQITGRIYLAGEVTLVAGLAIWITSLPQMRRRYFEIFYYTHHLYTIFLIFFLFHTGDRHFYTCFAGVFLYSIDKLLRIIQSRPSTSILSARILPSRAIELVLPKHPDLKFQPTSVIMVKIPSISKLQWHSFSLTSSSSVDNDNMSIMIKPEGWWTNSLYGMLQSAETADAEGNQRECIPISIEGPYGPASLDFLTRYENLLLVAGGIGITPFLSILQELYYQQNNNGDENKYPTSIQLVYAVKKSQDICHLNTILPLLSDVQAIFRLKFNVFVTQEENNPCKTFLALLNDLPQNRTINFNNSCPSFAKYGPENRRWMVSITALSSTKIFLAFLILFNHIFLSPDSRKDYSKRKSPSSEIDLILVLSFTITILCIAAIVITLRWQMMRRNPFSFSYKPRKEIAQYLENASMEDYQVHFGTRPNFKDIFAKMSNETGVSNIGVFACGPETMKLSVATQCKVMISSQSLKKKDKERKPNFSFHSLNFAI